MDEVKMPESAEAQAQGGGEVEYEFEVWQDDSMQAGGSTSDYATAKSEADHYALMYGQDGPAEVRMYEKRRITSPPSAPVGVEGLIERWKRDAARCKADGYTDAAIVKLDCAQQLANLAQQPAAKPFVGVVCPECNAEYEASARQPAAVDGAK